MRELLKRFIRKILRKNKPIKESFFTKDILSSTSHKIGDYTYGTPTILFPNSGARLVIGKFCSIAKEVTIFLGGNHRIDWGTTYPFNVIFDKNDYASLITGHPKTNGDVIIGNDVWIGRGASIMSGVVIGDGAVIGAYSLVSKNVGSYEVWAGNPAKFIKKRFDDITIDKLKKLEWWDWDIDKILEFSPTLCSDNFNDLFDEEFIKYHKK